MVIRNPLPFILLSVVLSVGCSDDETEIHHEFIVFGSVNLRSMYWQDSKAIALEGYAAFITDGIVVGSDVYAIGYINDGEYAGAAYWKNGKIVKLSTSGRNEVPTAITTSGSDIYIAGYEDKGLTSATLYWKNGERFTVSSEDGYARPTDIAVSGSDVYLVGSAQTQVNYYDSTLAAYWKNGIRIKLKAASINEQINSIVVSGGDVYFTGYTFNRPDFRPTARIWKNGDASDLIGHGAESYGHHVAIRGPDVFVAGTDGSSAVYWKNGIVTPIETGANAISEVNGMAIVDDHLIISGTNYGDGRSFQGSFVWMDSQTVSPFGGLDPGLRIYCIAANR